LKYQIIPGLMDLCRDTFSKPVAQDEAYLSAYPCSIKAHQPLVDVDAGLLPT
jgi:hypothetical protein